MVGFNDFAVIKVGNRPCDFKHSVVGSCGHSHTFKRTFQHLFRLVINNTYFFKLVGIYICVTACTCAFVAFGLNFSCFVNTLFNFGRRLRLFFISKLVKFNCRYLYMYIKTVKQRTADFIKVIMYLLRSTGAFS